jgi:hypothetical protein
MKLIVTVFLISYSMKSERLNNIQFITRVIVKNYKSSKNPVKKDNYSFRGLTL